MSITPRKSLFAGKSPTLTSTLLATLLFASVSSYSYAAESKTADNSGKELEEVIVTGSRTGRALNKIPGAVSIISAAKIDRDISLTADLTALLARTIPGYGESSQQMDDRGETLRGRKALRLLDGIPQSSPLRDGSRDNIFTDMGVIQRVEVVNGPSATEGIGASGGIINYITKTPTKMGTEVQVSTQYRTQNKTDSDSWRVAVNVAHKAEHYDILAAISLAETGIAYDGDGKTVAIETSGSDRDSRARNLFLKGGYNFGDGDEQRIEISHSRFRIECQCRYSINITNPEYGYNFYNKIPITSIKKAPPGGKASFNDFKQTTLSYSNNDLFGGKLLIQGYDARQEMRFESEFDPAKQDPLFAPFTFDANGFPINPTPLLEQSAITSRKKGVRSSWSTDAFLGYEGVGLQVGADVVKDTTQQKLALTNRSWVPPMKYTSFAPFVQASWDIDAFTFTAGVRHEHGNLRVNDFTTVFAKDRRFVSGGDIGYGEWLPNFGAIWRVAGGWSAYASYSKGFTLPNAGIPLRNQSCSNDTTENGKKSDPINFPFGGIQPDGCPNDPPISVNDILNLAAVVVRNIEVGIDWTGDRGKVGVSIYQSNSDFGSRLRANPDTQVLELSRLPERVQGVEATLLYNISDDVNVSAIYSSVVGKTASSDTSGFDKELGVNNISPNKLVVTGEWQFSEDGNISLGSNTLFNRNINVGKSGEELIKGYTIFNLAANYRLGEGTLSFGITNLLDKTYLLATSQVLFYRNYVHGRGREFTLGYTVTY